jgi:hypothetical protein
VEPDDALQHLGRDAGAGQELPLELALRGRGGSGETRDRRAIRSHQLRHQLGEARVAAGAIEAEAERDLDPVEQSVSRARLERRYG